MTAASTESHLLGVYNRAPLAFERGEGVRLYTTEGEEYLDCVAGIAVNALGHCHPKLVAGAEGPGRQAVARLQHLPDPRPGGAGRPAVRRDLRRRGVLHQLRDRGHRAGPEDRPQIPGGQGPARARSTSSPSRAPSTAAPMRRSTPAATRPISRASARACRASSRCPSATSRPWRRPSARHTAADAGRAGAGRGRRRALDDADAAQACASCATRTARC